MLTLLITVSGVPKSEHCGCATVWQTPLCLEVWRRGTEEVLKAVRYYPFGHTAASSICSYTGQPLQNRPTHLLVNWHTRTVWFLNGKAKLKHVSVLAA